MVSETLDFDGVDYYSESALVDDPFPFFEHLRSKGPVVSLPHHGVVAVTGYEEAVQICLIGPRRQQVIGAT